MCSISGKDFNLALPKDIEWVELFTNKFDEYEKSKTHRIIHISDIPAWLFNIGLEKTSCMMYYKVVQIQNDANVIMYKNRISADKIKYVSDFLSTKEYIEWLISGLESIDIQRIIIKYPWLVMFIDRDQIRPVTKMIIKTQKVWRYIVENIYDYKNIEQ